MTKPKGMPPYPNTPKSVPDQRKALLEELEWMEQSLVRGDFRHFAKITKLRLELKQIYILTNE